MDAKLTMAQRRGIAEAIEGYIHGSESFNHFIPPEVKTCLLETASHFRSEFSALTDLDKFIGAFSQHLPYTHIDNNEVMFGAQLLGWYKLHNLQLWFTGKEKLENLSSVLVELYEVLYKHIQSQLAEVKI